MKESKKELHRIHAKAFPTLYNTADENRKREAQKGQKALRYDKESAWYKARKAVKTLRSSPFDIVKWSPQDDGTEDGCLKITPEQLENKEYIQVRMVCESADIDILVCIPGLAKCITQYSETLDA